MDSLQVILDNAKSYENLAEKHSVSYPIIDKALARVYKFILDKGRILYGGMAIDLSLKASGHEGIYQEDAIPDFDIMSPDFYEDSNELANILCEEKYENISAINAHHITTRKVRVKFVTVADITYVPDNIYERIPYVSIKEGKYRGLKVLHPDFQRMDMHRAFCTPLSNPPQEVILHRLKKDQKRFRLLDKAYPLPYEELELVGKVTVKKEYLQHTVLGGIMGYALFYCFAEAFGAEVKDMFPARVYIKNDTITAYLGLTGEEMQAKHKRVTIITDYYENLIPKIRKKEEIEKVTYRNKYMDNLRPRTVELKSPDNRYEIFDNKGELLPCYNLQKTINIFRKINKEAIFELMRDSKDNNQNIYLAQPNHILLYFMQKYFEYQEEIYRTLYVHTLRLVAAVEEAFKLTSNKYVKENYLYLPFFLSSSTYGEFNWSATYIHLRRGENLRPVFGYYPECDEEGSARKGWDKFDPQSSFLYHIDGKKVKSFEPLSLVGSKN